MKSDVIVAASSHSNDIEVFKSLNSDEREESKNQGGSNFFEINHVSNASGGILCLDISPDTTTLAYGT